MLNKKYAGDLRPSMGPPSKKKPIIEGSPEEEASESPDEAHDEGDNMGDLFGDDSGDESDTEPMDLGAASDDDILAEARRRGLRLDPPKPTSKKSSYRSGADDVEADEDSLA